MYAILKRGFGTLRGGSQETCLPHPPPPSHFNKQKIRQGPVVQKRLKGPSQPVCIAAVCYCYYSGDLISFTVQMTRFVRIFR